jgi:hypothetical protein
VAIESLIPVLLLGVPSNFEVPMRQYEVPLRSVLVILRV